MFIDFFLERFSEHKDKDDLVWKEESHSYSWMLQKIKYWQDHLKSEARYSWFLPEY